MAEGGFWDDIAARLVRDHTPDTLARGVVVVPVLDAAVALNRALVRAGCALLPRVVALQDLDGALLACGLSVPPPANPWPLRMAIFDALGRAYPALLPQVTLGRVADIERTLQMLGEYDISPASIARSVPDTLALHWERHADVLLRLWRAHAADAAAVLPAARRAGMLRALTAAVDTGAVRVLMLAGVQAFTPAEQALVEACAHAGVPDAPLVPRDTPPMLMEADTPWDEVQRVALAVRQLWADGVRDMQIVAPALFARRLQGELARWSIPLANRASLTLGDTDWGQTIMTAARAWRPNRMATLGQWLAWALGPEIFADGVPAEARVWMEDVARLEGRYDAPTACAWLELALQARAPAPRGPVRVVGVAQARAVPADITFVCGMNVGVWPAPRAHSALSGAQRRALHLPDHATLTQRLLADGAQILANGSGRVIATRAHRDDTGAPAVMSPLWPAHAPPFPLQASPSQLVRPRPRVPLGTWRPTGDARPLGWSASLVESMVSCPYRAYAERVLNLRPLDPLDEPRDPRAGGLLTHAWLEAAGRAFPTVTAANADEVEAFLLRTGQALLDREHAVMQALWRPRLRQLAPALVRQWVADGRVVSAVEHRLETHVGPVMLHAKADRVEQGGAGMVIVDFKTGTPPTKAQLKDGTKPQLPLEAWMATRASQTVDRVAVWQLRGYGREPLVRKDYDIADLIEPVSEAMAAWVDRFGPEGAPWPALPDMNGGGVVPTGACEHCALAGLCRRADGGCA